MSEQRSVPTQSLEASIMSKGPTGTPVSVAQATSGGVGTNVSSVLAPGGEPSVDSNRRDWMMALVGGLGATTLLGCNAEGSTGTVGDLETVGQALNTSDANSFTDLRNANNPTGNAATRLVRGRASISDGGGGIFVWTVFPTGTAPADDDLTIIKPTAQTGSGRWVRLQTVKNIATLRALPAPAAGRPYYQVLGYYEAGDQGGGLFVWDPTEFGPNFAPGESGPNPDTGYPGNSPAIPLKGDNGGTIIKPTSLADTAPGRWKRMCDRGVYNVRHFGAKGDEATDDSAAIQLAIDACYTRYKTLPGRPLTGYAHGHVYFPLTGFPYTVRKALKLPQASQGSEILFSADNALSTPIVAWGCNAFERADALPGAGNEGCMFKFQNIDIAIRDVGQATSFRAVDYYSDAGTALGNAPPTFCFTDCHIGTDLPHNSSLLKIHGSGCRFYSVRFSIPKGVVASQVQSGVALELYGARAVLVGCWSTGALIQATSSETVMMGCRSEGAFGRPAVAFTGSSNVTIMNSANEGKWEEANFKFTNCTNVVLINPSLATGDDPAIPVDGIKFSSCTSCRVIAPYIPGPFPAGGNGSRAVRSDVNSRHIVVEGGAVGAGPLGGTDVPEYQFELKGPDSYVECLTTNWLLKAKGKKVADVMHIRSQLQLQAGPDSGPGQPIPVAVVAESAAPTSGVWNRGDRVLNSAPTAAGYAGWVCVVGGSPGIWKGFGLIEA